ncbi:hypothetical protein ACWIUA_12015 [Ursidibacter sp. B-7004-1]
MKYLPLCLMIAGTYYLLAQDIDGWGWSLFLTLIMTVFAYEK